MLGPHASKIHIGNIGQCLKCIKGNADGHARRREIDAEDEQNLDYYEGFPKYYTKHKRTVQMDDGSQIEGMVYIMNMIRPLIPHASYYNGIRDAYERLGLSSEIERVLEPALNRSIKRSRFRLR